MDDSVGGDDRTKQLNLNGVLVLLERERSLWWGVGQSQLSTLVKLCRSIATLNDKQQLLNVLIEFVSTSTFASDIASREKNLFRVLQAKNNWLKMDMLNVFSSVSRNLLHVDVDEHWLLANTFHQLYDLPKAYIYSCIIQRWTMPFTVVESSLALREFMHWCLSKEAVEALGRPETNFAAFAVTSWVRVTNNYSPIVDKQTFQLTMQLLPFDMIAIFSNGRQLSLRDIVEASAFNVEPFVANLLYPYIFPAHVAPRAALDIVNAIGMALRAGASFLQVQSICPFSDLPQYKTLMADIARVAAESGRLGVAVYYGFGSDLLAYINLDQTNRMRGEPDEWTDSVHASWHIDDFLDGIPAQNRIEALKYLGFANDKIDQIVLNHLANKRRVDEHI